MTARCDYCGAALEVFEGHRYCPDCERYTTAEQPLDLVKLVDTDPDIARERAAWRAAYQDEHDEPLVWIEDEDEGRAHP
jgi:hypothetical protein